MTQLVAFNAATVAKGYDLGPNDLSAGFMNFDIPNKITLKAGRFRMIVGGQEVNETPGPLSVVIQAANPFNSRAFYSAAYDANAEAKAPNCYSEDGSTPSVKATRPQANACALCLQNVKNAQGMKACKTFKRVVVTLVADPDKSLYQLDAGALTLFGDDDVANNKFNLKNLSSVLAKCNLPSSSVFVQVAVDTKATVSKMLFTPMLVLSTEEHTERQSHFDHAEIARMLKTDIAVTTPAAPALAPAPVVAALAAPVTVAPVVVAAPVMVAPASVTVAPVSSMGVAPASGSLEDLMRSMGLNPT
jgi:hypothetical protein